MPILKLTLALGLTLMLQIASAAPIYPTAVPTGGDGEHFPTELPGSPAGALNVGVSSGLHSVTTGVHHGVSAILGANVGEVPDSHAANADILSTDKYLGVPGTREGMSNNVPGLPGSEGGYLGGELIQEPKHVSSWVGGSYGPYPAAPVEYAITGALYGAKYAIAFFETMGAWATGLDINDAGMPEGTANRFLELDTQLLDDFDKLTRGGSVAGRRA